MKNELTSFEDREFQSAEKTDWSYARNARCCLMTASAEWVQSTYSCRLDCNGKTFIAPDRDYPYEGLLTYQGGENWKFIDCIAISAERQDNQPLSVIASTVGVNPWRMVYWYRVLGVSAECDEEGGVPFSVSYYLNSSSSPELIAGCIDINFPRGLVHDGVRIIPTVQPFIDIRHMFSHSDLGDYELLDEYAKEKRIHVSNRNRRLTFSLPPGKPTCFGRPEILNWRYKLGTGSRVERLSGYDRRMETTFIDERKDVAAFFNLELPESSDRTSSRILFTCNLNNSPTRTLSRNDLERLSKESEVKDRDEFQQIVTAFPLSENLEFRDAIWARIVGLTKFKTFVQLAGTHRYVLVPHAGAWWFKTPWYRDAFEGILNSFETLMRLPREREGLREIILLALRFQDENTGLISTRIPEFNVSELFLNSTDATLLCFIVANSYVQKTGDTDFAREILPHVMKTISRFCDGTIGTPQAVRVDGPPRVDNQSGLLLSAPHHSWIDTCTRTVRYCGCEMHGLPNRASVAFIKDLYDQLANKDAVETLLCSPVFFLPEINAQWITALRGTVATTKLLTDQLSQDQGEGESISKFGATVQSLLHRAEQNFLPTFWNDETGFLFNMVYADRASKDAIECETAITSAAMLGETIFTQGQLRSIWQRAKRKLLVYRRPVKYAKEMLPFGVVTKNEDQRVFYDDDQYHSDVVWPRSTPYLIRLLQFLSETDTIRGLLINTLDHQETEGAIFYNQELFSRPYGNNLRPDEFTRGNPVPVKNPIQFWSQWCDPFIKFFGEGAIRNG